MPVNSRLTAIMIQDQLTLCLTKVIEQSMFHTLGSDWYFLIKEDDVKSSSKAPPILEGVSKIEHCDFQSLLKLMVFRENIRNAVIETWNIDYSDTKRSFNSLLRQLMNYRNNTAHNNAEEIERELSGKESNRILDTDRSITDMVKLAMIFKDVKNDEGISYYEVISKIQQNYEKGKRKNQYSVPETLKKEKLNITPGEFIDIVHQNNIEMDVFDADNGSLCFATENYDVIVEKIRYRLHRRKSFVLLISAVFMALVLIMMVLFVIPYINNKSYNDGLTNGSITTSNKLIRIYDGNGIEVYYDSINLNQKENGYDLFLRFFNVSGKPIQKFIVKNCTIRSDDDMKIIAFQKENAVISSENFFPSTATKAIPIKLNCDGEPMNILEIEDLTIYLEIF